MQSLSDEEATLNQSPVSYLMFSKVAGCLNTGFSMGVTMEVDISIFKLANYFYEKLFF